MQLNFNAHRIVGFVTFFIVLVLGWKSASAQNFDQQYLNWKAQQ